MLAEADPGRAGALGVEEGGANSGEIIDDAHVHGRVVDIDTARPLGRRTTVVFGHRRSRGASQTTTDERGEFSFDRPKGSYDAAVLEPDGSAVTVLQGAQSTGT